jgi:hypothetical protein
MVAEMPRISLTQNIVNSASEFFSSISRKLGKVCVVRLLLLLVTSAAGL